MVITDAGRAALVAAEGTTAVVIAQAGFTDATFVAAPTLTALPGQFKTVDTVAGQAVDDVTVHLVIRDSSDDAYSVRGIGLYLADGTLFAVYSQPAAILGKAAVSTFHLAVDIKFLPGEADLVALGNTNFLNPPATEVTKGVAYLALLAEVLAGDIDDKIVTPATLKGALANYVRSALLGQPGGVATLDGAGKLSGGQRPIIDAIDVYPVATEAAMLALAAATAGDFAVRVDTGFVFILQATPAATLGNWIQLATPAPVTSVNGKVGAVVLTAADVGAPPVARAITGGGLATGGGSLAADRVITVLKASQAEAEAGLIDTKAVTPFALAGILAALLGRVQTARLISGTGLATGGGDLSADRAIDVAIASAAEILTGTENGKAVTPLGLAGLAKSLTSNGYYCFPGGLILQWAGMRAVLNDESVQYLGWPIVYPLAALRAFPTAFLSSANTHRDQWVQLCGEPTQYGAYVQVQHDDSADNRIDGIDIFSIGL
jgi:hypothetical protein